MARSTKNRFRHPRRKVRGLTLIEILVVVTILGLISGIISISVANASADAREKTTRVTMSNLRSAVTTHYAKLGSYPTTAQGLQALVRPRKGRPIMDVVPQDAWGKDFVYIGPTAGEGFQIISAGADGVTDTDDDLRLTSRPR